MKVVLPDNLYDHASVLGAKLGVEPEAVLKLQLTKWGKLDPTKRLLLLDQGMLEQLEAKFGQITDGDQLLAKIDRLGSIAFMGKDLRLSINQIAELTRRAERQGTTVERLLLAVWNDFAPAFFDNAMGTEVVDRPPVVAKVNGAPSATP